MESWCVRSMSEKSVIVREAFWQRQQKFPGYESTKWTANESYGEASLGSGEVGAAATGAYVSEASMVVIFYCESRIQKWPGDGFNDRGR